jgi:hypothetical protein
VDFVPIVGYVPVEKWASGIAGAFKGREKL